MEEGKVAGCVAIEAANRRERRWEVATVASDDRRWTQTRDLLRRNERGKTDFGRNRMGEKDFKEGEMNFGRNQRGEMDSGRGKIDFGRNRRRNCRGEIG
ncbi:hypothetical protein ACLOJK_007433 [Asimina triloba]